MKQYLILLSFCGLLQSCKKENTSLLCLKVKVIGYDYCSPASMGAQILSGPAIGENYQGYDNVIAIYNMDKNRLSPGTELYVQVRNSSKDDNLYSICPDIYPSIVFSKVRKWAVSSADNACQ